MSRSGAVGLLCGWIVLGCTTPSALRTADVIASTNEPFYQVRVAGEHARFEGVDVAPRSMTVSRRLPIDGGVRIEAIDAIGRLQLILIERPCADDMSGAPFPLSAIVVIDERSHRGCGRTVTSACSLRHR